MEPKSTHLTGPLTRSLLPMQPKSHSLFDMIVSRQDPIVVHLPVASGGTRGSSDSAKGSFHSGCDLSGTTDE